MAESAPNQPATPGHPTSPEHLRALTHPLSWRILRLCLDEPWTNQQLAERLDVSPATLLRRVRALTDGGFLVAEPPRQGEQGAWERPYRATGRTWRLRFAPTDSEELHAQVELAVIDAHRAEAEDDDAAEPPHNKRAILRLDPESRDELYARVDDLLDEFRGRATPDGAPVSILWSAVQQKAVDEP